MINMGYDYPPEWDEPDEEEESQELDFDEDYEPEEDADDEDIERALHDYERKIYNE